MNKDKDEEENANVPPKGARACYNCFFWHRKNYIHCQHSEPLGGNIPGDKKCTFTFREGREQ